jgi:D-galactarolactone isomerase
MAAAHETDVRSAGMTTKILTETKTMTPRRPCLALPPGACDTHMHFYDSTYPASDRAWLFPPDFTVAEYRQVQARTGLQRLVLVQPVTYGFDNRCILDKAAEFGDEARAVVTVPVETTDAELAALWRRGARGLRFHQMRGGMMDWAELPVMAGRIRGSGWHVQLQLDGLELPVYESLIASLPCTVVIDHIGRYSQPVPVAHAAFQALLRLAARDNIYVKLSGAYHISRTGGPAYADVAPLARALVAQSTQRLLWASDWPHPTETAETMPDEADLLDLLMDWAPEPAAQRAILSDNPARLYGFGS